MRKLQYLSNSFVKKTLKIKYRDMKYTDRRQINLRLLESGLEKVLVYFLKCCEFTWCVKAFVTDYTCDIWMLGYFN